MAARAPRRAAGEWLVKLFGLLCVLFAGCGARQVTPLDLHDTRLPIEARRWVADAQDTLAIANARVSDARLVLRDAQRAQSTNSTLPAPIGAELDALQAARVNQASTALGLAGLETELAEERLVLAHARTAMRHDLEVYELGPIEARVEAAQKAVLKARASVQTGRIALQKQATAWWSSWQKHVSAGGDTTGYWRTAR